MSQNTIIGHFEFYNCIKHAIQHKIIEINQRMMFKFSIK